MAEIQPSILAGGADIATGAVRTRVPRGSVLVTWSTMAGGDAGKGVLASHFSDKNIEFTATFGTSTFTLEGSNNSTNGTDGTWFTLADPQGNPISKTVNFTEQVLENPVWVRPNFGTGTGTGGVAKLSASTVRG